MTWTTEDTTTGVRLTKCHAHGRAYAHGYDVWIGDVYAGYVWRTGTLPSCQTWWAEAEGMPHRTRRDAVTELLGWWTGPKETTDA